MSEARRQRPGDRSRGTPPDRAARAERDPRRAPLKDPAKRSKEPYRKPEVRQLATTLWEYPSQHYGEEMQGDKAYVGATPSWVIWQLLQRYTRERDLIVDPMCGSGTTMDVARDLGRRAIGYDLRPTREDIFRADARELPLEDEKADFVFIDPPYSTHVDYSDDPRCIGKLDAGEVVMKGAAAGSSGREPGRGATGLPGRADRAGTARAEARGSEGVPLNDYYSAMREVIGEIHRIMRPRRYMALYVSDSFKKGRPFMPIGFELFGLLSERFTPVDIICVVRHNAKLKRGNWHKAAIEGNYFLRGFNYLFIMKKEATAVRD